jgi:DNA polymerase-1
MKLILDGNNTAYRAHATTNLTTKSGENVSAIYGTLNIIQSYLKKSGSGWKNKMLTAVQEKMLNRTLEVDEVVVCWDGGKSKWRRILYPDYKGHREKKRADKTTEEQNSYYQMLDQMEVLHEMLPHFGVKSLKVRGWEADDLIYATTKFAEEDDICVIVSTDKDMLQLVDERTFVWSPFKETLVTLDNFTQFTGVPKRFYLSYRILVGDKSDNIDGIYGIGDKKAKDLIIKYGDIQGMQSNAPALMKSVVTKRIVENPLLLKRNEELMDMRKIPLQGANILQGGDPDKGTWVDGIEEDILAQLNQRVKFERELVKAFLMSKQFISILKDFTVWSNVFTNLK